MNNKDEDNDILGKPDWGYGGGRPGLVEGGPGGQPLSTNIYVLTRTHNLYDQCGNYFVTAWVGKPSAAAVKLAMKKHENPNIHLTPKFIEHILAGGGRIDREDIWYNLEEVKEDK